MIEKMAMGLVDQMAEEKMIDKEAEEYYVYTLVSLMEKFITIGTILLISVLIEKLVPTAFFLSYEYLFSMLFGYSGYLYACLRFMYGSG